MRSFITVQKNFLDFIQTKSEMLSLVKAFDWSKTPLGTPETWPPSLKTSVSLVLQSGFPMALCWGSDLIQIYNDAFMPIFGRKSKSALGYSACVNWGHNWSLLEKFWKQALEDGQTVSKENFRMVTVRNGFEEEAFFTFSYSPLRDEEGKIAGVLISCVETTEQIYAEKMRTGLKKYAMPFLKLFSLQ